jgi:putative sterol carrier protein
MRERSRPPDDISPAEFFTRWVPESVARDSERRARLGDTRASLVFELTGEQGGAFTVEIVSGEVRGLAGRTASPDLEVRVDLDTWRQLNRGELSAPEALLRRRIKLSGDFILALKLHLILG